MSDNGFSLLIVDDNPDNRDVLAMRLRRLGYRDLTMAVDGAEALEVLGARTFDLVLLDIMMPNVNGYEVLERLRGEGRLAGLPVIVVSALDEMESVVRCIELGAEDYLTKPINATLLKARIGACLEKKRLRDEALSYLAQLERELAAARDIQLSMVPTTFPAPSADLPVEVFARLEPARQVGGDLYDVFVAADGALYVAVADVSDKGAPAALFMARTKTMLRLLATAPGAAGPSPDPADVVAAANVELCRDNPHGMFVTLLLARIADHGRTLAVCNAGHGAPYRLSPRDGVTALAGPRDKPLGIRPGFAYRSGAHTLDEGDGLFLYTDGITEAMDPAGALFSEERLEAALGPLAGAGTREVVDGVIERVREFAAGAPPSDDIAALALRRLG